MKVYVPRDYQRALQRFAVDSPRCQWWAGTGVGKTVTWLSTFDELRMFGDASRLLVVATKTIATIVWPEELKKWENFQHLSMAVAVGTPDERLAAIRRRADITVINYDNLPWLVETVGEHWPFDMVIPDESTKLKNLRIDPRVSSKGKAFDRKSGGSSRAFSLASVAHKKVRRWINGTGLAAPNGLIDLWGQAWYVDGGRRLGRTFTSYKERWFNSIQLDAYRSILRPTSFADGEIKDRLRDITLTVQAKDFMDLPEILINRILVPLPPKARRHYDEMEQEYFTEIDASEIDAVSAGSRSMKLRQLASGIVYDVDQNPVTAHTAKIDRCEDIVEELAGASVVIVYQFVPELELLKKRFPGGKAFDKRAWAEFRAGQLQLLFVHPASAGHGVDGLQEYCCDMIIYSQTWDLEHDHQVIERIGPTRQASSGRMRDVRIHRLIGQDTIEEEMVERIETKMSVAESVALAMKRRFR